ncbi:hypothetical protein BO71DRAFT_401695 [Aspergillus ellipticus CBS 707.79]|uniref:Uncharacterized protein n=1 Tax=Aspergillus ellipticus CBS 707.79 TaxID=1448320 RepID=A0A319D0F5_9EURO|nr:hypothetical protein BO71DRAFT_401695 [Aspergillus ellipticus CBS 707.79]
MVPLRRDVLPERPLNDYERWLETQSEDNHQDPSSHASGSQHIHHHHALNPHGSFTSKHISGDLKDLTNGILPHHYNALAAKLILLVLVVLVLIRVIFRPSRPRHRSPIPRTIETEGLEPIAGEKGLL